MCVAAQAPDVVEVEPRRRQQVGAVVVLELEHRTDEREAVRVHARRGQPDDVVPSGDGRAVDQAVALDDPTQVARSSSPSLIDGPATRPSRRRSARRPLRADLGGALDEVGHLLEVEVFSAT